MECTGLMVLCCSICVLLGSCGRHVRVFSRCRGLPGHLWHMSCTALPQLVEKVALWNTHIPFHFARLVGWHKCTPVAPEAAVCSRMHIQLFEVQLVLSLAGSFDGVALDFGWAYQAGRFVAEFGQWFPEDMFGQSLFLVDKFVLVKTLGWWFLADTVAHSCRAGRLGWGCPEGVKKLGWLFPWGTIGQLFPEGRLVWWFLMGTLASWFLQGKYTP